MRRTGADWLRVAAAPALLVLVACGGGSSTSPTTLQESAYAVTAISVAGSDIEVQQPVVITFSADAVAIDTPCNDMGGSIEYGEATLTVGPLALTKMGCEPALMEQDQVIAETMAANPTWQLSNGTLTLTGGDTVITAQSVTADVSP
jgi:heat shock protein HslJ